MTLGKNARLVVLCALFVMASGGAYAQCPPTNSSPAFTAGGSVFGKIAAQWNSYFAAKVDANNGILCNPTIVGGSSASTSIVGALAVGAPTGGLLATGTINTQSFVYQNGNLILADIPTFNSFFINNHAAPALTTSSSGGISDCSGIYGRNNAGIGPGAASAITNGCNNVGVGPNALQNEVHGVGSTAVGYQALQMHNAGEGASTAVGYSALGADLSGVFNAAFGNSALQNHTSGDNNLAAGAHAMLSNLTGNSNVALGGSALFNDLASDNNVVVGALAAFSQTAGTNTVVGEAALFANLTGTANTVIGTSAMQLNTSASDNTVVGDSAGLGGASYTSSGNTLVGKRAGYSFQTGASDNLLIGEFAGYGVTTGTQNIVIGGGPASGSLTQITTGTQNIAIGFDIQLASPTAGGQLDIGNYIYGTGLTGTTTTISSGKIGFGIKAPVYEVDVAGTINAATAYRIAGTVGADCAITGATAHLTVVKGLVTVCN